METSLALTTREPLDLAMPEVHLGIPVIEPIKSLFYLSQLEICFSHLQPREF